MKPQRTFFGFLVVVISWVGGFCWFRSYSRRCLFYSFRRLQTTTHNYINETKKQRRKLNKWHVKERHKQHRNTLHNDIKQYPNDTTRKQRHNEKRHMKEQHKQINLNNLFGGFGLVLVFIVICHHCLFRYISFVIRVLYR